MSGLALLTIASACCQYIKYHLYYRGVPHLFNAAKDVRLAVFVSVRAHTQVDFPRVLVRLEGFGDPYIWKFYYGLRVVVRVVNTENWIRGTGGNGRPARNRAKGVGKGGRGATGEGGYEHSSTINEWRK